MNSKRHVIFDLDGTLVDSIEVVRGILNLMRAERNLKALPYSKLLPLVSMGGIHMVSQALCLSESESLNELEEFRQRYLEIPTPIESIYPEVPQTLMKLKSEGCLISICTNKPRNLAEKVLIETGLEVYIDSMCAGGDLKTQKPDPKNVDACLINELKRTSIFFVGDSQTDQLLASRAGIRFIFHTAGYNEGVNESQVSAKYSHYRDFPYDLILDKNIP